jgi:hypothetical protein
MTVDLLGPASLNAVTTRPARDTSRGSTDTWFQDCSTSTSTDGTAFTADWHNDILAQMRTVIVDAGVVQDNADDMLWRAIQQIGIRYCVDSGTASALVVANTPPVPAYRAGLALAVKTAAAPTGATTIVVDGLASASILNVDGYPLIGNEWPAGRVIFLLMDDSLHFRLIAPLRRLTLPACSNLTGSSAGGVKTASWTIGAIVADAPGGVAYRGDSLSLSFNGATTGAGGMDTGSTPTSADLSIYAIYNPTTNTWAALGCAGSTSNGAIYSGSNMPSGYTASQLISSLKTNSSGQFYTFIQLNRLIEIAAVRVLSAGAATSGTSLSLASVVPANANWAAGNMDCVINPGGAGINLESDAIGTGRNAVGGLDSAATEPQGRWELIIATAQTIYYNVAVGATGDVDISSYGF